MGREDEARLRWRCRRGLLELDLVLGSFLDRQYRHLMQDEQAAFARLLELADPTLVEMLLKGSALPDDPGMANIVNRIRQASEV